VGKGVLVGVAVGKGVNKIEVASRDLITGTDGVTDGEGEATSSGAFVQAAHRTSRIRIVKEEIKRFMVPSEMKRTDTCLHYTRVSLSFYPRVVNFLVFGPIDTCFVGATLVVARFLNLFH
jgi:hypothetical protein